MEKERKYLLTIKRDNNDYLSVEWNLTSFYNGENLYTLEGIDEFTKKITRVDLLADILAKNMIDCDEKFMDFVIIYYENGKNREVKDGTIFLEDENVLFDDLFILFVLENLGNKKMISFIYNMCDIKSESRKLEEFKYVLRNADIFRDRGVNGIIGALSLFKEIEYDVKRRILLRLSKRIVKRQATNQGKPVLSKNIDDKAA